LETTPKGRGSGSEKRSRSFDKHPRPAPTPPDAGKHFRAEAGIAQPAQAKILLRTDSLNPRNKQTDARKGEALRQKRFLSPRYTATGANSLR